MLNILKAGSLRMSRESNSSTRQRPSSSLEHAKGMAASLPGKAVQDVGMIEKRADYEQQLARKFRAGDVYSPHDLSGQEMSKWKKSRNAPKTDAIDALGINPINEYKVRVQIYTLRLQRMGVRGGAEGERQG
jgi:small subunit ribosomal protein S18